MSKTHCFVFFVFFVFYKAQAHPAKLEIQSQAFLGPLPDSSEHSKALDLRQCYDIRVTLWASGRARDIIEMAQIQPTGSPQLPRLLVWKPWLAESLGLGPPSFSFIV